ncbi:MAG: Slp family lipoprotein [bacterium]
MREKIVLTLAAPVLLLIIMSCAHSISREARDMAVNDIPFQWIAENPGRYRGAFVLWGGEIINSQNLGDGALIEVLQRPLGYSEEPDETKNSSGRFLVLYDTGILDPAIFRRGVKITVAGIVEGERVLRLGGVVQMGKVSYVYPYIIAREVHLWENDKLMNQFPYY